MVPTVALPPVTPLTDQTGVALVPVTAAVNCWVAPVCTEAVAGVTSNRHRSGRADRDRRGAGCA